MIRKKPTEPTGPARKLRYKWYDYYERLVSYYAGLQIDYYLCSRWQRVLRGGWFCRFVLNKLRKQAAMLRDLHYEPRHWNSHIQPYSAVISHNLP